MSCCLPFSVHNQLTAIFQLLLDRFGPQYWWPGDTRLEIIVGAVLTQNTNWTNASRAIANLKAENLLSLENLLTLPTEYLAQKIRSSGYYNQKAVRLQNLIRLLVGSYGPEFIKKGREDGLDDEACLDLFFADATIIVRNRLLTLKGIGPETADSILLYAGNKPVFVVDAYTHRFLTRHSLIPEEAGYDEIQDLFMSGLPADRALFNEYHALIVRLGKEFCKKSAPLCAECPLQGV